MLMLRWLALGAAAGASLTMGLHVIGLKGPWQGIALVMALLTTFAVVAVIYHLRKRDHLLEEAVERSHRDGAELSALQHELARHAELEQELRQAKQAADSAVMAKGEFLATMSHEIRTPLNGIVPMLDLLMHSPLAPDHAEMVRTAYTSSQQMLRIVDDILDYSKLEANKLDLETTSFNLRELLEGVLQLMERPAHSKGLRLNLQIDSAVRLPVRSDPIRLRQVLGNLISNAVKFTDRGSVTVSLRKLGETAAQHRLRFEVSDTGIGISPSGQSRLFQAFSQADASTTRLYGGTGLGLAISKRIVDLMGGQIGVDSVLGQGATFWFEVPMLKVHGDMPSEEKNPQDGRLLLLSADPRLRLRLSMLLPNWGLRISAVETTQEALDRLRIAANQGPPWAYSLVLADLSGMRNTALALYRNLGRQTVYGDLRLVCLYGDDPIAEELQRSVTLISRQAPDADLRSALFGPPAELPQDDEMFMMSPPPFGPPPPSLPPSRPTGLAAETPAAAPRASDRKARGLVVEDNPVDLMVGQRLLGVLGITCDTAANGELALQRIAESRYDIVLMDCQMPVMDGYTATQRLRGIEASGGGRRLPVIAMTASAMAGDRQKCLDAGMDDYLPQPGARSELERCLNRWWDPEQSEPAPESSAAVPDSTQASVVPVVPATAPSFEAPPPVAQVAPVASAAPAPFVAQAPTTFQQAAVAPAAAASADPQASVVKRPQPAIIDHEVIEELRSMLGGEVDRLIEVFLDDSPRLINDLEAATLAPDYDALRDAAHSLKSSSANLGAMSLSAAAKRVELAARERSLERPAVAVALIANEFHRARTALLAMMQAPRN